MKYINCYKLLKDVGVKDTYSMHTYLVNRMMNITDVNYYTINVEFLEDYIEPLKEMPLYAFNIGKISNIDFLTDDEVEIESPRDECPCKTMKWYKKNIGEVKV